MKSTVKVIQLNGKIKTEPFFRAIIIIVILLVLGLVGSMDYEDQVNADEHYCMMVDLHKSTKGESGYPDYNKNYKTICNK